SLSYTEIEDCDRIIEENKYTISYWFFTGYVPYYYCLNRNLINKDNSVYPQVSGEGLMSILFKYYRDRGQVSKMGFDVFPITVIEETLESLGLRLDFFDSIGMQSHSDHEKIITHHLKNLKNNKVDVIVTSLSKVEQYLKTQEFPV